MYGDLLNEWTHKVFVDIKFFYSSSDETVQMTACSVQHSQQKFIGTYTSNISDILLPFYCWRYNFKNIFNSHFGSFGKVISIYFQEDWNIGIGVQFLFLLCDSVTSLL